MSNIASPTTNEQNAINIAVMGIKVENIEKTTTRTENALRELTNQFSTTYETKIEAAETKRDVAEMRDDQKWLRRLVWGTLIGLIATAVGAYLIR